MLTLSQIQTKLYEYLSTLGIVRTNVTEGLINLLAYSIYVDECNQLSFTTQMSLPLSTSINSKLFHASNILMNIDRGSLPRIIITNVSSRYTDSTTRKVNKLEKDTEYNGYYLYYANDYEVNNVNRDIEMIVSKYELSTIDINVKDDYIFVDTLTLKDISNDLWFYNDNDVLLKYTTDCNAFFDTENYDLLVITIKDYGIRILRKINTDTQSWGTKFLRVKYFKYSTQCPTKTDLLSNLALMNYKFSTVTDIKIQDSVERQSDLSLLTEDIIRYRSSRDIVCTTNHLKSFINDWIKEKEKVDIKDILYNIEIVKDTEINTTNIYLLSSNADTRKLLTDLTTELQSKIDTMKKSLQLELITFVVKGLAEDTNYNVTTYTLENTGGSITQSAINNIVGEYNNSKIDISTPVGYLLVDITKLDTTITNLRLLDKDNNELKMSDLLPISFSKTGDVIKYNYIEVKI